LSHGVVHGVCLLTILFICYDGIYLSIFVIGVDPRKKTQKNHSTRRQTIQHVFKLAIAYSTRFNKLFSIELSFNTVHNYSTLHSTHYSTPHLHSTLYSTLNKTVNSDPNGRKPLLNRIYRNFLHLAPPCRAKLARPPNPNNVDRRIDGRTSFVSPSRTKSHHLIFLVIMHGGILIAK
jgi:hypothetical protein